MMLELLGVVIVFLVVIGIAALMAAKLGLLKPQGQGGGEKTPEPAGDGKVETPYGARARVLSPAEASFHSVLRQALPIVTATAGREEPPLVLAKVRLSDIFVVRTGAGGQKGATAAQNRINSKHVDFLLCAPDTTRPLLLIELDDASHERASRKKRDEFVDRAAAAAGVPILHVKAAAGYSARGLAEEIGRAMGVVATLPNGQMAKWPDGQIAK